MTLTYYSVLVRPSSFFEIVLSRSFSSVYGSYVLLIYVSILYWKVVFVVVTKTLLSTFYFSFAADSLEERDCLDLEERPALDSVEDLTSC